MRHAVFLTSIVAISAMILSTSVIGLAALSKKDAETEAPKGQIDLVDVMSRNEVRLRIGECSEPVSFDRCLVVIFSPDNEEVNVQRMQSGRWAYQLSGAHISLSSLAIVDDDRNSKLDPGDSIYLSHSFDLQKGAWTLRVFVDDPTTPMFEEVFVIPDRSSTPCGAFHDAELVSNDVIILTLGIWNTDVPYYYTSLSITAPDDMTADIWNIEQLEPYTHSYNDTIQIRILDDLEKDIVNYNDAIMIVSTSGPLATGDWTVSIRDDFTSGIICQAVITVPAA